MSAKISKKIRSRIKSVASRKNALSGVLLKTLWNVGDGREEPLDGRLRLAGGHVSRGDAPLDEGDLGL